MISDKIINFILIFSKFLYTFKLKSSNPPVITYVDAKLTVHIWFKIKSEANQR